MIKIVGVRFRNAGKIYYFDPDDMEMETGTHVIVETARGVEFGVVMIPPKEVEDEKVPQPLKPVIRIATDEDEKQQQKNKEKQEGAYKICLEKIEKHGLEMKLVQAEYTFDNNKLLFYFTADGRIDFRELVKDPYPHRIKADRRKGRNKDFRRYGNLRQGIVLFFFFIRICACFD